MEGKRCILHPQNCVRAQRFLPILSTNLGRIRHRNLVQLWGWCTKKGEILVVYDYLMKWSLSKMLCHKKGSMFDWPNRYKIVKGFSAALLYLNEEWEKAVVHKVVTASNMSLHVDPSPRLGSFALAEFVANGDNDHHATGVVRVIFGYMSPEYVASGRATTEAEIFSFGVVVLEVVSGRITVYFRFPDVLLVDKIRQLDKKERLVDVRLEGQFDQKEMNRLLNLGFLCTRWDSKVRPTMRQVAHILEGDDHLLTTLLLQKEDPQPEWESNLLELI